MGWFIFSIIVVAVSYLIAKKAEKDRLDGLDFIELCKAIARDEGLGTISDDMASKVIYDETGWCLNCWNIPRDGDTPREALSLNLNITSPTR